jgi:hypothetical protein
MYVSKTEVQKLVEEALATDPQYADRWPDMWDKLGIQNDDNHPDTKNGMCRLGGSTRWGVDRETLNQVCSAVERPRRDLLEEITALRQDKYDLQIKAASLKYQLARVKESRDNMQKGQAATEQACYSAIRKYLGEAPQTVVEVPGPERVVEKTVYRDPATRTPISSAHAIGTMGYLERTISTLERQTYGHDDMVENLRPNNYPEEVVSNLTQSKDVLVTRELLIKMLEHTYRIAHTLGVKRERQDPGAMVR